MNTSRAQLNRAVRRVLLENPRAEGDTRAQLVDALREVGQPDPDEATIDTGLGMLAERFTRLRTAVGALVKLVRDETKNRPPKWVDLPRGVTRYEYSEQADMLTMFDQDLDTVAFDEVFGCRRPDDDIMPVTGWITVRDREKWGMLYVGERPVTRLPNDALVQVSSQLHQISPELTGVGLDADLYLDHARRCLDVGIPARHLDAQ